MQWEFDLLVAIQGMRSSWLDVFMAFMSNLGNAGACWMVLSTIFLIVPKTRKIGLQMWISIIVTFIIGNLILKPLINRARPCDNMAYQSIIDTLIVERPHDASFPSGHSMNAFTTAVALLLCDKRWGIPAIIVATIIAFSRLYNFMHFPTDVLAGIVIGTVIAILVHALFVKKGWYKKEE